MRVDTNALCNKISQARTTKEEFASKIGMDPSTFHRKMKADGLAFTVGQMHKIVDVLGLNAEEAKSIFLG